MTKARLFKEYASCHGERRNRVCHAIGTPLFVLGLMALASHIRFGGLDLAIALSAIALGYYATIDVRGAAIAVAAFAVFYLAGTRLGWQAGTGALIVGVSLLGIGHRFDGTKPKFLDTLIFLAIGPLYLLEECVNTVTSASRSL